MDILTLVELGESLKSQISENDFGPNTLAGEDYSKWISKCVLYLEREYTGSELVKRFIAKSKDAIGNSEIIYFELLGIIKAVSEDI